MKLLKLVVLGCIALLCSTVLVPAAFAQSGTAKVRVIHASPDAPAVDVYVNGAKTLNNVRFFTASPYLDLPAGRYRLQVTPAGADVSSAVIDAEAAVEAGKGYTIAATGKLAEIKPTIIVEDMAAPAAGKARVRVYHFSPDAPAVDVKVKGGDTLIPNLAFPSASTALEVDAGSYDLQVTPAGAATPVVIDLPSTRLEASRTYDVFATGLLASIKPEVVVTTPAAATAPATPGRLPTTSEGDVAPLALMIAGAVVLIGAGAFIVRRRSLR